MLRASGRLTPLHSAVYGRCTVEGGFPSPHSQCNGCVSSVIGYPLARRGLRGACGRVIAQGGVGSGGLVAAYSVAAHSSRASVDASSPPDLATAAATPAAPAVVALRRCLRQALQAPSWLCGGVCAVVALRQALQVLAVLAAPVAVAALSVLAFAAVVAMMAFAVAATAAGAEYAARA